MADMCFLPASPIIYPSSSVLSLSELVPCERVVQILFLSFQTQSPLHHFHTCFSCFGSVLCGHCPQETARWCPQDTFRPAATVSSEGKCPFASLMPSCNLAKDLEPQLFVSSFQRQSPLHHFHTCFASALGGHCAQTAARSVPHDTALTENVSGKGKCPSSFLIPS